MKVIQKIKDNLLSWDEEARMMIGIALIIVALIPLIILLFMLLYAFVSWDLSIIGLYMGRLALIFGSIFYAGVWIVTLK